VTDPEGPCERLDWDSRFFGVSIAIARMSRADDRTCRTLLDWCASHEIDCLYFLAAADDTGTREAVVAAAFSLVDERVTLVQDVDPPGSFPASRTRSSRPADISALRAIAAVSHHDSRFYRDGHFAGDRCDELYRTWIERSCRGWADHVLVADRLETPVGYLTIHRRGAGNAAIGLVAVDPSCRGLGVGRQLIQGCLSWLADSGIARVSVVTQGGNAASLSFYRRVGFRVSETATWYHRWFPSSPETER
jgi:dTDP-4-amino-4,6-dideoxy-D-galactose acyltransferase